VTRGLTVACVLATVSLFASARPLAAQEMDVPVDVQLPILLKVLTFDRKLATRAPREAVVAVAFQGGNRASVVAKDAALRILRATPQLTEGVALRVVTVDLDDTTLDAAHAAGPITHLYLTPLRATDVREIATWARKAGITTMSGVTRHVESGLALGVGMRGGRPRILVNVEASRLEGAELSAELLKLAEIVQ
jgi:hypothetical protein